jgi:hypothetical protein
MTLMRHLLNSPHVDVMNGTPLPHCAPLFAIQLLRMARLLLELMSHNGTNTVAPMSSSSSLSSSIESRVKELPHVMTLMEKSFTPIVIQLLVYHTL